ncbi:MAG: endonuclease Q family protein [Candidatus Omnitrophica bacterium]|nr:endonuclease Q family protein [Candidatus Omnitrophota bacterium]
MKYFIADFHIHSKYSRATSREMEIENLSKWAVKKGIALLGTGDFTHPDWLKELKAKLDPMEYGLFKRDNTYFLLTAEVSNIYFKNGKSRKVHNIIFAPSFEAVQEINKYIRPFGDLKVDGRPILDLDCEKMAKAFYGIDPDIFIVPGHIWTPWFSLFGSNSGFDDIEACFGRETNKIFALESGLSSDPAMNWRWSKLDKFSIISNSDSHSPSRIGREANVFKEKFTYKGLVEILKKKDKQRFLFTVEFFPQEGKYHWDGHRNCKTRLSPAEAKKINERCPECGRRITVGVMHRLEDLADRKEGFTLESGIPFKNLVPLDEIIAEALGVGKESLSVEREYNSLLQRLGSEFEILLEVPDEQLLKDCSHRIARGILKVRKGEVQIEPGYDGEYGTIKIFKEGNEEEGEKQLSFF